MLSQIPVVCIIDDDVIYQYTITKTLQSKHLADKIISFSDGEKAIHFFSENIRQSDKLPDIIFLDINMPVMDGWQFIDEYSKLKSQLEKKITVFMVSSSVDERDINRAKLIPEISEYMIKPIDSSQLQRVIQNL